MKQTPAHDVANRDVLALIHRDATRVVEVGCSSGALAKAFLAVNPGCEYVGIDIDPDYAQMASASCTRTIAANIELLDDGVFDTLFPSSCWVFGDILEHLYDPWAVLRRIRAKLSAGASVVACIPNAQHWSMQARLNCGALQYEEAGLMDRTHIRWFTKTTVIELFNSAGLQIVEGGARVLQEPDRDRALVGIRALAQAIGADPEQAVSNAIPFQWVVRAIPG
jgi:2-polyprenyl-3-methyl-5-hydroxy-6-metoxy-1,4-benzoquinol methylase